MKSKLALKAKTLIVFAAVTFGAATWSVHSKTAAAESSVNSPISIAEGEGARIYAASCARCHGSDGQARTGKGKQTGAVDLTGDDWEPNVARDTRIVTNGKGKMPGFKRSLKPEEIQSVVLYIRKFKI